MKKLLITFILLLSAIISKSQSKLLEIGKAKIGIDEYNNLIFINADGQKSEIAYDVIYNGKMDFWVNVKDSVIVVYATAIPSPFVGTKNSLEAHLDFYKFDDFNCTLQKSYVIDYTYDSYLSVDIYLSSTGALEIKKKGSFLFKVDVMSLTEKGFQLLHDTICK